MSERIESEKMGAYAEHTPAQRRIIRIRLVLPATLFALCVAAAPATQSTTQPAAKDAALDFLLGSTTTAPTSQPDVLVPAAGSTPLVAKGNIDPDARDGTITLNDGTVLMGHITTTVGKPLRVWDEKAGEYRDIPMRFVKSIKAQVVWERDEKEWRFKESGSDIKVYTGRTYPARELAYAFTLTSGKTVEGAIDAPLHVQTPDADRLVILHKRDKGELGQTLKDLTYVQEATFVEQK